MTVCGFCKGQPVGNAAAWTSLNAPKYAPCPRCGVYREPKDLGAASTARPDSHSEATIRSSDPQDTDTGQEAQTAPVSAFCGHCMNAVKLGTLHALQEVKCLQCGTVHPMAPQLVDGP